MAAATLPTLCIGTSYGSSLARPSGQAFITPNLGEFIYIFTNVEKKILKASAAHSKSIVSVLFLRDAARAQCARSVVPLSIYLGRFPQFEG